MKPRKAQGKFGSPYGKGEAAVKERQITQVHRFPYIWVDELEEIPMNQSDREREREVQHRLKEEFIRVMEEELFHRNIRIKDLNPEPVRMRPTYQYQKPPPPPTHYLIQYIGGPFNAQQEFFEVAKNNNIRQGALWEKLDYSPDLRPSRYYRYKLTFVPQSETPFSDAQVIIGIFQE